MPFTKEEGGLINNFAPETKIYQAEPPSNSEKRNYLITGIVAIALIGGLLFIAYSASNIG
ncbi:MAG TPA: ssl1498 family light-harvesting-like protein [Cyanophyceae cyanobacterium]